MSSSSETIGGAAIPPRVRGKTSPFETYFWSVRREIWEHKSLYVAPLAVAALMVLGAIFSTLRIAAYVHHQPEITGANAAQIRMAAFGASALAIIVVEAVVSFFYCLAALNGERRDRSILFWKSLPISDLTAVLAKASIPLLIMPVFDFVVIIALQTILLILGSIGAMLQGAGPGLMGADLHLPQMWAFLLYGLVVTTLWYAPIFGWLLMVSAWSKRAPFLWAVLPPLALALVERLSLNTNVIGNLLHDRVGGFKVAFQDGGISNRATFPQDVDPLQLTDPGAFLASPGLWGGLIAAAVFLAATVYFRRNRDPV
jgi:ABC-2 type transport system permease protein